MNIKPNAVDLSHYDDVTDWDAVKAFGIIAVINKATDGPGMIDKTFAIRRGPVEKREMLYAAYHFMRPGAIGPQVDHFLASIGDTTNLGLALDFEQPAIPLANAKAFLVAIKDRVGRYPWLYSYSSMLHDKLAGNSDPFWKTVRTWLAQYTSTPSWPSALADPFLWQYTGDGSGQGPHRVPGISLDTGNPATRDCIDINSFDGTPEELAALWTSDPAVAVA